MGDKVGWNSFIDGVVKSISGRVKNTDVTPKKKVGKKVKPKTKPKPKFKAKSKAKKK